MHVAEFWAAENAEIKAVSDCLVRLHRLNFRIRGSDSGAVELRHLRHGTRNSQPSDY
jgi:hypothetical protein